MLTTPRLELLEWWEWRKPSADEFLHRLLDELGAMEKFHPRLVATERISSADDTDHAWMERRLYFGDIG